MNRREWMRALIFGFLAFPADTSLMKWGVSTSAYQIEGAWDKDGKGLSIWDEFAHTPGNIADGSNADIGPDHYHHVEEDLDLIQELGVQTYRFSLSWPRILPNGKTDLINEKGVAFYNRLIDGVLERNLEPLVTLWHWDTPLALQNEYQGWEDDKMLADFEDYARLCFEIFGDRVKNWITLNEPLTLAQLGYAAGSHAPGKREPSRLPYEIAHRMLRAHARVYHMFHREFDDQLGKISIALNSDFIYPGSESPEDKNAAERGLLWRMGWFADPLFMGDYPPEMRERCGERIPVFHREDHIFGALDFFALNHYTSLVGFNAPNNDSNLFQDPEVSFQFPIGSFPSASSWLHFYPQGLRDMIEWIENRYNLVEKQLSLCITESGVSTFPNTLEDQSRINYIRDYSTVLSQVNPDLCISHYCIWSVLDNFEWAVGYTERFGLIHIDFTDPSRQRVWKQSAIWLKSHLSKK